MVDDAELLRRYTESYSEPAFAEFVGRHLNLVYFTALRRTGGDAAVAQDITQAVFTVAARRAQSLITHAMLAGWLHTTTRHIADRMLRKERTRQRYENEAARHDLITGGAEYDWGRIRPVIDDALDDLAAHEREAILGRFFEARAFADLGATWRISQDAARMRVDRALDKLRVALEDRGISSVSAALGAALAAQGAVAAPAGMLTTISGAVLAAAVSGGGATFFSIMSGTKIIISAAAAVLALTTGTAVYQHLQANTAKLRLDVATRELAIVRRQLARTQQQKSAAESAAAEADKDSGALLAAMQAVRANATDAPRRPSSPASNSSSVVGDPLAQTLQPLFPNGIVATVGDRAITVEDVRREITPLLSKVQPGSDNPAAFRQRVYALQNSVVADLVARQLDIKEFHNPVAGEAPKHVSAEWVDSAMADRVRAQFNNNDAQLLAYLDAQGVTLAQYRQNIEEDLIYAYMRAQQRRLTSPKTGPGQ